MHINFFSQIYTPLQIHFQVIKKHVFYLIKSYYQTISKCSEIGYRSIEYVLPVFI